MINRLPYAAKLQLIFLPLILIPLIILGMLVLITVPPLIRTADERLLGSELYQAYGIIEQQYLLLQRTGLEQEPFFVRNSESRILGSIRDISPNRGSFLLIRSLPGPGEPGGHSMEVLLGPEGDSPGRGQILPLVLEELTDHIALWEHSNEQNFLRIGSGTGDRALLWFRYFKPWQLIVGILSSSTEMNREINSLALGFISLLLVMLVTSFILIRLFSNGLSRPLSQLAETVSEFGEGNLKLRAPVGGNDEIAVLAAAFNIMAERISSFTRDLSIRVEERTLALQQNLELLQHTQAQLIESEKLAGLGSVVSGVAHEINTPLGVGITSATFLDYQFNEMLKAYGEGTLTKGRMDKFLEQGRDSLQILLDNLNRAQKLVQNFKEISADQMADEQRFFNFHQYLEEILASLRNQLKKVISEISLEGEPGLILHSHPGAFWQIFSNLLQNSLVHAFPEGRVESPKVSISWEQDEGDLNIIFSDNGVGMSTDIRDRAFEPFVTTRRGQGGTGLGLNIVYNIVSRMGGRISIESSSRGTSVFIHLPDIIGKDQASGEKE